MSEFSIRTRPFRLNWADYRTLRLAAFGRIFTMPPLALLMLSFYVGVPLVCGLTDLRHGKIKTYLCCQAACLGFGIICFLARLVLMWRDYRHDPMMGSERVMVLDSGAIRMVGQGFDIRQTWDHATHAYQGRDHVFLTMRDFKVHVIPKRALLSPGDTQILIKAARAASQAPNELVPLPEAPDTREQWRSQLYTMTFALAFGRGLHIIGLAALFYLVIGLILLAAQFWIGGHAEPRDIVDLIGSLACTALIGFVVAPMAWLGLRHYPGFRGQRDLCFTRDYIRCTGTTFDRRFDWSHVRDVRRNSGAIVFCLVTGSLAAPVSAFATPAQATAFFTQAVAFWRAAQARS